MRSRVPATMQTGENFATKFGKQKACAAFKFMFGGVEIGILCVLGTEHIRHVLRTAHSIGIICDFDARVADIFRILFKTKEVYVQVHYRRVLHSASSRGSENGTFANLLNAPTAFEISFYFHSFMFVHQLKDYQRSRKLDAVAASISVSYKSGMRISLAVHSEINVWKLVLCRSSLGIWNGCIASYLYCDMDEAQFKILQLSSDLFIPFLNGKDSQKTPAPGSKKAMSTLLSALATIFMTHRLGCLHCLWSPLSTIT